MDAYDYDFQINRPEREWPLARTQYKKLYMDAATMSLSENTFANPSKVSYDGATGIINFDMKFEEDTEITGHMMLRLFVEAEGNDDMDLFINIQKLDEEGNWLPVSVLGEPHPGSWGKMRASARTLDPKLSTDYRPVQAHRDEQKLEPGEIVPVDIEIWPSSRLWHKGQQLRVQIAGHYIREGWFERLSGIPTIRETTLSIPADNMSPTCKFRLFRRAMLPETTYTVNRRNQRADTVKERCSAGAGEVQASSSPVWTTR